MVEKRRHDDAEDDGYGLLQARGEHQRKKLCLVADFAERDHDDRYQKCFHDGVAVRWWTSFRRTARNVCHAQRSEAGIREGEAARIPSLPAIVLRSLIGRRPHAPEDADPGHTMPRSITFTSLLFLLVMAGVGARASYAAPVRTAHVEAELVAERTALMPGRANTVALRLVMERGWHTYWQNAGDSGLPTTLTWKLPPGLDASPIQWPAPRALPVGPLVNYGYEGEVLLLNEVSAVPDFLSGKTVTLSARADWLVCKEICIPEGADLSLTLPVITDAARVMPDPRWGEGIAKARASVPRRTEGWNVTATGRGLTVELHPAPAAGHRGAHGIARAHFFPYVEGQIEASGAQSLTRQGADWTMSLPVASQRVGEFRRVAGILVSGGASTPEALVIDVPLEGTTVAGPA